MTLFPINGWNGRSRVECAPRKPLPKPETATVSQRHRLDLCLGYARLLPVELKRELAGRLLRDVMDDEHPEAVSVELRGTVS